MDTVIGGTTSTLKLVFSEVTAGHTREYHTIDAVIPASTTTLKFKDGYEGYLATTADHRYLPYVVPIPCNGEIEIRRNNEWLGLFSYNTPTHPDPDHHLQVPMPNGMI